MNFTKKKNEFCDIPGFDATKGERIAKALQKLRKKIHYLEQRISEKCKSDTPCSSKEEDLTLTDVQYKLLLLQLQYVRTLLCKKFDSNRELFEAKLTENGQKYILPTNVTREDELTSDIVKKHNSTEFPVSNSVVALNLAKKSRYIEDKSKNMQITSDDHVSKVKRSTEDSAYLKRFLSSSKPHYHLKLDDVPFILGASSTASHSVFANMQNIIAMMKLHNKALCGPKPIVSRSAIANTHSTGCIDKTTAEENSEDVTKQLNTIATTQFHLSRALSAIAVRQQVLAEGKDAKHIIKPEPEVNSQETTQYHGNKISYGHAENNCSRSHRSHSDSEVKLHAKVKKMPKMMEKNLLKHNVPFKQSSSACNVKPQKSHISIIDRRKLLRSLQNFKSHLSEEDISWG